MGCAGGGLSGSSGWAAGCVCVCGGRSGRAPVAAGLLWLCGLFVWGKVGISRRDPVAHVGKVLAVVVQAGWGGKTGLLPERYCRRRGIVIPCIC